MFNDAIYSEEELGLFNPAFTGFNLYHGIVEYCKVDESGMHCALPFILIPISLNSAINRALPATYRTPIAAWIAENEGLMSSFVPQAEAYIPIVKSAISFLMERGIIKLSEEGSFLVDQSSLPINPSLFMQSEDMKAALRTAKYLGKWFAHAPSPEAIYAQLGLTP